LSNLHTSFGLGYHGCDQKVGLDVIAGRFSLIASDRDYDWLGPGSYFWESDPRRALEWAEAKAKRTNPPITPFVIGAVIDLGNCLDLTVREDIEMLRDAYDGLLKTKAADGAPMPRNRDLLTESNKDKLFRNLDCAVIRYLHDSIEQTIAQDLTTKGFSDLDRFDTVRGTFSEGEPVYPDSGFYEKTHTQIAVRSLGCIKGVFRVGPNATARVGGGSLG
jgi:hypothetical protein